LRVDATERGALFGAPLFGAPLAGRGARDDVRGAAVSTESMAAMRSACVMPDMSTEGTTELGGGVDALALTARGAAAGAGAAAGDSGAAATGEAATPPLAPADGAIVASPLISAEGAADFVACDVESGVPSGALRTT